MTKLLVTTMAVGFLGAAVAIGILFYAVPGLLEDQPYPYEEETER